jgi:dTDP-4-dehydrorhamnose 3,5-epimerase
LHFQWPPSKEAKLVRCQRGSVFDVIVDLRPESASFMQHICVELSSETQCALYIPAGFAHGFQTLEDNCDIHYMMTDTYQPDLYGGVRYDDPAFDITWPLPVTIIDDRDRNYSDFDSAAYTRRYQQGQ